MVWSSLQQVPEDKECAVAGCCTATGRNLMRRPCTVVLCCVSWMVWSCWWPGGQALQDACLQQLFFGTWKEQQEQLIWRSLDPDCKVSSYIDAFNTYNLSIVFFGDSMERYQIHDVHDDLISKGIEARLEQDLLLGANVNPDEDRQAFDSVLSCHLPNGYLQWTGLIPGAWPSGEYYQPELHNGIPGRARISKSKDVFEERRGGSPDMVILNINLWDTYRFEHDGSRITNEGMLHEWRHHFWGMLMHIDEVFPSTRLRYYHTTGRSVRFPQPVVMELNAAGGHLAHRAGWNIVDLSSMVNFFQDTNGYLRDPHHPKAFVLLALFDVYMSSAARLLTQDGQAE